MRLYNYMSMSSDSDESKIRSLNIDLVEEDTGNTNLITTVLEKHGLDDVATQLLERANKELKTIYRGKLKFDFCLENQGTPPEKLRIGSNKIKRIKEKWFDFNNELSEIQIKFENSLQK